jgi:methylglutaconyl-CoA hydratase
MYKTIEFRVDARGVAWLTLNRPGVKNAMNGDMYGEAREVVARVNEDAAVRVLVLTGAGDAFCAGGDFKYQQSQALCKPGDRIREASKLALWLNELDTLSKPLLGRINGAAYGGGIGLVSVCDYAVGAADARFCLSEVGLGMVPGMISPFVVRKIGVSTARDIMLSAKVFDASQAKDYGLIHDVVSTEDLDAAVERRISAYLRCGPEAIATTKRLISFVSTHDNVANFHYTVDRVAEMWTSDEAQEGMTSFLEKRKPSWAI